MPYRYVREARRGNWQARVWMGEHEGHLNLGCYRSPMEAWRVVIAFIRRGILPSHLMPKWVRRITRHRARDNPDYLVPKLWRSRTPHDVVHTYFARVTRDGVTYRTVECETPELATAALQKILRRAFGPTWAERPCAVSRARLREKRFATAVSFTGQQRRRY